MKSIQNKNNNNNNQNKNKIKNKNKNKNKNMNKNQINMKNKNQHKQEVQSPKDERLPDEKVYFELAVTSDTIVLDQISPEDYVCLEGYSGDLIQINDDVMVIGMGVMYQVACAGLKGVVLCDIITLKSGDWVVYWQQGVVKCMFPVSYLDVDGKDTFSYRDDQTKYDRVYVQKSYLFTKNAFFCGEKIDCTKKSQFMRQLAYALNNVNVPEITQEGNFMVLEGGRYEIRSINAQEKISARNDAKIAQLRAIKTQGQESNKKEKEEKIEKVVKMDIKNETSGERKDERTDEEKERDRRIIELREKKIGKRLEQEKEEEDLKWKSVSELFDNDDKLSDEQETNSDLEQIMDVEVNNRPTNKVSDDRLQESQNEENEQENNSTDHSQQSDNNANENNSDGKENEEVVVHDELMIKKEGKKCVNEDDNLMKNPINHDKQEFKKKSKKKRLNRKQRDAKRRAYTKGKLEETLDLNIKGGYKVVYEKKKEKNKITYKKNDDRVKIVYDQVSAYHNLTRPVEKPKEAEENEICMQEVEIKPYTYYLNKIQEKGYNDGDVISYRNHNMVLTYVTYLDFKRKGWWSNVFKAIEKGWIARKSENEQQSQNENEIIQFARATGYSGRLLKKSDLQEYTVDDNIIQKALHECQINYQLNLESQYHIKVEECKQIIRELDTCYDPKQSVILLKKKWSYGSTIFVQAEIECGHNSKKQKMKKKRFYKWINTNMAPKEKRKGHRNKRVTQSLTLRKCHEKNNEIINSYKEKYYEKLNSTTVEKIATELCIDNSIVGEVITEYEYQKIWDHDQLKTVDYPKLKCKIPAPTKNNVQAWNPPNWLKRCHDKESNIASSLDNVNNVIDNFIEICDEKWSQFANKVYDISHENVKMSQVVNSLVNAKGTILLTLLNLVNSVLGQQDQNQEQLSSFDYMNAIYYYLITIAMTYTSFSILKKIYKLFIDTIDNHQTEQDFHAGVLQILLNLTIVHYLIFLLYSVMTWELIILENCLGLFIVVAVINILIWGAIIVIYKSQLITRFINLMLRVYLVENLVQPAQAKSIIEKTDSSFIFNVDELLSTLIRVAIYVVLTVILVKSIKFLYKILYRVIKNQLSKKGFKVINQNAEYGDNVEQYVNLCKEQEKTILIEGRIPDNYTKKETKIIGKYLVTGIVTTYQLFKVICFGALVGFFSQGMVMKVEGKLITPGYNYVYQYHDQIYNFTLNEVNKVWIPSESCKTAQVVVKHKQTSRCARVDDWCTIDDCVFEKGTVYDNCEHEHTRVVDCFLQTKCVLNTYQKDATPKETIYYSDTFYYEANFTINGQVKTDLLMNLNAMFIDKGLTFAFETVDHGDQANFDQDGNMLHGVSCYNQLKNHPTQFIIIDEVVYGDFTALCNKHGCTSHNYVPTKNYKTGLVCKMEESRILCPVKGEYKLDVNLENGSKSQIEEQIVMIQAIKNDLMEQPKVSIHLSSYYQNEISIAGKKYNMTGSYQEFYLKENLTSVWLKIETLHDSKTILLEELDIYNVTEYYMEYVKSQVEVSKDTLEIVLIIIGIILSLIVIIAIIYVLIKVIKYVKLSNKLHKKYKQNIKDNKKTRGFGDCLYQCIISHPGFKFSLTDAKGTIFIDVKNCHASIGCKNVAPVYCDVYDVWRDFNLEARYQISYKDFEDETMRWLYSMMNVGFGLEEIKNYLREDNQELMDSFIILKRLCIYGTTSAIINYTQKTLSCSESFIADTLAKLFNYEVEEDLYIDEKDQIFRMRIETSTKGFMCEILDNFCYVLPYLIMQSEVPFEEMDPLNAKTIYSKVLCTPYCVFDNIGYSQFILQPGHIQAWIAFDEPYCHFPAQEMPVEYYVIKDINDLKQFINKASDEVLANMLLNGKVRWSINSRHTYDVESLKKWAGKAGRGGKHSKNVKRQFVERTPGNNQHDVVYKKKYSYVTKCEYYKTVNGYKLAIEPTWAEILHADECNCEGEYIIPFTTTDFYQTLPLWELKFSRSLSWYQATFNLSLEQVKNYIYFEDYKRMLQKSKYQEAHDILNKFDGAPDVETRSIDAKELKVLKNVEVAKSIEIQHGTEKQKIFGVKMNFHDFRVMKKEDVKPYHFRRLIEKEQLIKAEKGYKTTNIAAVNKQIELNNKMKKCTGYEYLENLAKTKMEYIVLNNNQVYLANSTENVKIGNESIPLRVMQLLKIWAIYSTEVIEEPNKASFSFYQLCSKLSATLNMIPEFIDVFNLCNIVDKALKCINIKAELNKRTIDEFRRCCLFFVCSSNALNFFNSTEFYQSPEKGISEMTGIIETHDNMYTTEKMGIFTNGPGYFFKEQCPCFPLLEVNKKIRPNANSLSLFLGEKFTNNFKAIFVHANESSRDPKKYHACSVAVLPLTAYAEDNDGKHTIEQRHLYTPIFTHDIAHLDPLTKLAMVAELVKCPIYRENFIYAIPKNRRMTKLWGENVDLNIMKSLIHWAGNERFNGRFKIKDECTDIYKKILIDICKQLEMEGRVILIPYITVVVHNVLAKFGIMEEHDNFIAELKGILVQFRYSDDLVLDFDKIEEEVLGKNDKTSFYVTGDLINHVEHDNLKLIQEIINTNAFVQYDTVNMKLDNLDHVDCPMECAEWQFCSCGPMIIKDLNILGLLPKVKDQINLNALLYLPYYKLTKKGFTKMIKRDNDGKGACIFNALFHTNITKTTHMINLDNVCKYIYTKYNISTCVIHEDHTDYYGHINNSNWIFLGSKQQHIFSYYPSMVRDIYNINARLNIEKFFKGWREEDLETGLISESGSEESTSEWDFEFQDQEEKEVKKEKTEEEEDTHDVAPKIETTSGTSSEDGDSEEILVAVEEENDEIYRYFNDNEGDELLGKFFVPEWDQIDDDTFKCGTKEMKFDVLLPVSESKMEKLDETHKRLLKNLLTATNPAVFISCCRGLKIKNLDDRKFSDFCNLIPIGHSTLVVEVEEREENNIINKMYTYEKTIICGNVIIPKAVLEAIRTYNGEAFNGDLSCREFFTHVLNNELNENNQLEEDVIFALFGRMFPSDTNWVDWYNKLGVKNLGNEDKSSYLNLLIYMNKIRGGELPTETKHAYELFKFNKITRFENTPFLFDEIYEQLYARVSINCLPEFRTQVVSDYTYTEKKPKSIVLFNVLCKQCMCCPVVTSNSIYKFKTKTMKYLANEADLLSSFGAIYGNSDVKIHNSNVLNYLVKLYLENEDPDYKYSYVYLPEAHILLINPYNYITPNKVCFRDYIPNFDFSKWFRPTKTGLKKISHAGIHVKQSLFKKNLIMNSLPSSSTLVYVEPTPTSKWRDIMISYASAAGMKIKFLGAEEALEVKNTHAFLYFGDCVYYKTATGPLGEKLVKWLEDNKDKKLQTNGADTRYDVNQLLLLDNYGTLLNQRVICNNVSINGNPTIRTSASGYLGIFKNREVQRIDYRCLDGNEEKTEYKPFMGIIFNFSIGDNNPKFKYTHNINKIRVEEGSNCWEGNFYDMVRFMNSTFCAKVQRVMVDNINLYCVSNQENFPRGLPIGVTQQVAKQLTTVYTLKNILNTYTRITLASQSMGVGIQEGLQLHYSSQAYLSTLMIQGYNYQTDNVGQLQQLFVDLGLQAEAVAVFSQNISPGMYINEIGRILTTFANNWLLDKLFFTFFTFFTSVKPEERDIADKINQVMEFNGKHERLGYAELKIYMLLGHFIDARYGYKEFLDKVKSTLKYLLNFGKKIFKYGNIRESIQRFCATHRNPPKINIPSALQYYTKVPSDLRKRIYEEVNMKELNQYEAFIVYLYTKDECEYEQFKEFKFSPSNIQDWCMREISSNGDFFFQEKDLGLSYEQVLEVVDFPQSVIDKITQAQILFEGVTPANLKNAKQVYAIFGPDILNYGTTFEVRYVSNTKHGIAHFNGYRQYGNDKVYGLGEDGFLVSRPTDIIWTNNYSSEDQLLNDQCYEPQYTVGVKFVITGNRTKQIAISNFLRGSEEYLNFTPKEIKTLDKYIKNGKLVLKKQVLGRPAVTTISEFIESKIPGQKLSIMTRDNYKYNLLKKLNRLVDETGLTEFPLEKLLIKPEMYAKLYNDITGLKPGVIKIRFVPKDLYYIVQYVSKEKEINKEELALILGMQIYTAKELGTDEFKEQIAQEGFKVNKVFMTKTYTGPLDQWQTFQLTINPLWSNYEFNVDAIYFKSKGTPIKKNNWYNHDTTTKKILETKFKDCMLIECDDESILDMEYLTDVNIIKFSNEQYHYFGWGDFESKLLNPSKSTKKAIRYVENINDFVDVIGEPIISINKDKYDFIDKSLVMLTINNNTLESLCTNDLFLHHLCKKLNLARFTCTSYTIVPKRNRYNIIPGNKVVVKINNVKIELGEKNGVVLLGTDNTVKMPCHSYTFQKYSGLGPESTAECTLSPCWDILTLDNLILMAYPENMSSSDKSKSMIFRYFLSRQIGKGNVDTMIKFIKSNYTLGEFVEYEKKDNDTENKIVDIAAPIELTEDLSEVNKALQIKWWKQDNDIFKQIKSRYDDNLEYALLDNENLYFVDKVDILLKSVLKIDKNIYLIGHRWSVEQQLGWGGKLLSSLKNGFNWLTGKTQNNQVEYKELDDCDDDYDIANIPDMVLIKYIISRKNDPKAHSICPLTKSRPQFSLKHIIGVNPDLYDIKSEQWSMFNNKEILLAFCILLLYGPSELDEWKWEVLQLFKGLDKINSGILLNTIMLNNANYVALCRNNCHFNISDLFNFITEQADDIGKFVVWRYQKIAPGLTHESEEKVFTVQDLFAIKENIGCPYMNVEVKADYTTIEKLIQLAFTEYNATIENLSLGIRERIENIYLPDRFKNVILDAMEVNLIKNEETNEDDTFEDLFIGFDEDDNNQELRGKTLERFKNQDEYVLIVGEKTKYIELDTIKDCKLKISGVDDIEESDGNEIIDIEEFCYFYLLVGSKTSYIVTKSFESLSHDTDFIKNNPMLTTLCPYMECFKSAKTYVYSYGKVPSYFYRMERQPNFDHMAYAWCLANDVQIKTDKTKNVVLPIEFYKKYNKTTFNGIPCFPYYEKIITTTPTYTAFDDFMREFSEVYTLLIKDNNNANNEILKDWLSVTDSSISPSSCYIYGSKNFNIKVINNSGDEMVQSHSIFSNSSNYNHIPEQSTEMVVRAISTRLYCNTKLGDISDIYKNILRDCVKLDDDFFCDAVQLMFDNKRPQKLKDILRSLLRGDNIRNNFSIMIKKDEVVLANKKFLGRVICPPENNLKTISIILTCILEEHLISLNHKGLSSFCCGNSNEMNYKIWRRAIAKYSEPVVLSLDGAAYDSKQFAELQHIIHEKIFELLMTPQFYGYEEFIETFIQIFYPDHHLTYTSSNSKQDGYPDVILNLHGTSVSGHPLKTTYENTVKAEAYAKTILACANISGDVMCCGDDTLVIIDRKDLISFFKNMYQVYNPMYTLGQVCKAVIVNGVEVPMDCIMIFNEDNTMTIADDAALRSIVDKIPTAPVGEFCSCRFSYHGIIKNIPNMLCKNVTYSVMPTQLVAESRTSAFGMWMSNPNVVQALRNVNNINKVRNKQLIEQDLFYSSIAKNKRIMVDDLAFTQEEILMLTILGEIEIDRETLIFKKIPNQLYNQVRMMYMRTNDIVLDILFSLFNTSSETFESLGDDFSLIYDYNLDPPRASENYNKILEFKREGQRMLRPSFNVEFENEIGGVNIGLYGASGFKTYKPKEIRKFSIHQMVDLARKEIAEEFGKGVAGDCIPSNYIFPEPYDGYLLNDSNELFSYELKCVDLMNDYEEVEFQSFNKRVEKFYDEFSAQMRIQNLKNRIQVLKFDF